MLTIVGAERTLTGGGGSHGTEERVARHRLTRRRRAGPRYGLERRLFAEALGTALLLATVVGSGIMGERLAGGNVALALLANSLATGAALIALISAFGPISGAHFNPVVTLVQALRRALPAREVPAYVAAQVLGAFAGVVLAHAMFGEPMLSASTHVRAGDAQALSEVVATFGLVAVILATEARRPASIPLVVGAYITAAYWFTASTSFANPAVTLARAATNTFAGIRPVDVPAFVVAQLAGGAVALVAFAWLQRRPLLARAKTSSPALADAPADLRS